VGQAKQNCYSKERLFHAKHLGVRATSNSHFSVINVFLDKSILRPCPDTGSCADEAGATGAALKLSKLEDRPS